MTESGSKSKKRSGASSKSKPLEPVVLFLDRFLGKKIVAAALRQAGVEARVHDELFPPNALDQEWLPVVGEKGWVVLTKDSRIRYRASELAAIKRAGARVFTLTGKDLKGLEMAAILVGALPAIERFVAKNPAPFIAKITKRGGVSMWVTLARRSRHEC